MTYAQLAEVEALTARRTPFSEQTRPTADQVLGFIETIAGQLDASLSAAGVTVPVTEPDAFLSYVTHLNAIGAAALTEMVMFPEADRGSASSSQGDRYWSLYKEGLTAIADGSGIAADAPRTSSGSVRALAYALDNPDALTEAQLTPVFSMQTVF